VKPGAASALLAALIMAGCVTTPAPQKPLTVTGQVVDVRALRAVPLREKALGAIEQASRESLEAAAQYLATPDAAGIPDRDALAIVGNALFGALYPGMESPFPADTPPAMPESATPPSEFLGIVIPALSALSAGSPIPDPTALAKSLHAADTLRPASVLPPYLEGLLAQRAQGDMAAARVGYEEALRRSPTFFPAAGPLAGVIITTGRAQQELALLLSLASLLPAPRDQLEATARAYLAGGKPDLAADAAAQGLLATPDDPAFALLRAQALEAGGDWYQAIRILDVLLKLQPGTPEMLLMRAQLAFEKQGNNTQALAILSDAENTFPNDPRFPEMTGRILLETGIGADGEAALERALTLAPGRASTISLLLHDAVKRRQWADALRWLNALPPSTRGPEDLRGAWEAATALVDHATALSLARALETVAPGAVSMILEARSLVANGEPAAAIPVIDAALPLADSAALRAELYSVRSTAASGDPVGDLRSALREDPDSLPALIGMVDALAAQQDYRKALEYARHAASISPQDAALAERVSELETMTASGK
jgi:tetratricopeptide (TPR) repeat protein